MSGAAYTPRPGSNAEAAALVLQARGELSTAELADEIESDSGTLHALLAVPIKWGYLAREKREGITWWRMGDGTPPAAEPDDDPPVQRVVKAASAPPAAPRATGKKKKPRGPATRHPARTGKPTAVVTKRLPPPPRPPSTPPRRRQPSVAPCSTPASCCSRCPARRRCGSPARRPPTSCAGCSASNPPSPRSPSMTQPDVITEIALEQLHESPFNQRQLFRDIEALATSIRSEGRVLEPLLVRPRIFAQGLARRADGLRDDDDTQDGFEIVFGHRRLRAAEAAGLATVPCMVRALDDAGARSAQIAALVDRPTAIAAANWSERKVEQLAAECRQQGHARRAVG